MNAMHDVRSEEPCDVLPWDSEFWGFPVARVRGHTLTPEGLASIDRWCKARSIACLYFLATFDDPTTVRCAEDGRFRLVDTKITFGRASERFASSRRPDVSSWSAVRPAVDTDLDPLRRIAAESFRDTRFYFDRHFPRGKCGLLYERWLIESFNGYADQVLVADKGGFPVGFITCHLPTIGGEAGSIGLLCVAAEARRRGVGRELKLHALDWFAEQQVQQVTAATQGRNVATLALNQRCGFVTRSFELWYHKWFLPPDPGSP